MYLSQVEISNKKLQYGSKLSQLQNLHGWVESCYPQQLNLAQNKRDRHLWRIDTVNSKKQLLILSKTQPNKKRLELYGIKGSVKIQNYSNFLNSIDSAKTYFFRLTANTVKADGHRVYPLIGQKNQKEWILTRSEKNGFKITKDIDGQYDFRIISDETPILKHRYNSFTKLRRVTFEGTLKITNIDQFKYTLTKGIGREKAYGMGLLTVIPIN